MSFEVSKMQKINENAEAECQVEFVPKGKLPRIDRPFGNGVLGYKVNGMKKHPHCKWMAIQEPKFIDLIRNEQNIKALKILNKTKH
jgi:hypothetical protein